MHNDRATCTLVGAVVMPKGERSNYMFVPPPLLAKPNFRCIHWDGYIYTTEGYNSINGISIIHVTPNFSMLHISSWFINAKVCLRCAGNNLVN